MNSHVDMSLLIYIPAFWVIAIISTILQDRSANGVKKLASLTTVIKLSPALISVIYVLLTPTTLTLFYILLAVALVFCMFGDVAMEVDLVPGIGMFLIAHILYNVDFLWHASNAGLTTLPMAVSMACLAVMVVYVLTLIRYLQSSGAEVPPFILRSGIVYFLLISGTLSTSILLWLTTSNPLGFIPVIGVVFFILSDSLLAVNAFRQKITHHELYIMPTYYLAIFLLALSAFVYVL
ncbi:MAG: lysoplasmalogenase family protein [Candidatus Thorarchaeota archaeon]